MPKNKDKIRKEAFYFSIVKRCDLVRSSQAYGQEPKPINLSNLGHGMAKCGNFVQIPTCESPKLKNFAKLHCDNPAYRK